MTPVDRSDLPRAAVPAPDTRRAALVKPPQRGSATASAALGASPSSVVRFSAGTKASEAVRRAIEVAPEVRQGRVATLRSAIDAGRYNVDPDKIAARMVAAVL